MTRFKRMRTSWLRSKPKRKRVLWRSGRVIEDAAGMKALRLRVYQRADGRCEVMQDGVRCNALATWQGQRKGELSHIVSRSHGGSDIDDNCLWSCYECHRGRNGRHKGPQWTRKDEAA